MVQKNHLTINFRKKSKMLDRNSYIPLYVQVRDELKNKIDDDVYKVGDMIPSEKELMEEFLVGRATIREAVNLLVSEGNLDKRQGVGTFVKEARKKLGFEPLISLDYIFRNSGIRLKNKLLSKRQVKLDKDLKELGFAGESVFEIKRIRYNKQQVALIERIVFNEDFEEVSAGYDFTRSIGSLMREVLEVPISKISQDVEVSKPEYDLADDLGLDEDEKVLYMKRRIYLEGDDRLFQFYEMWVNAKFSDIALKNIFNRQ